MSELLTEYVATNLTPTDLKRLEKLAEQQERTIAWITRKAVQLYLDAHLKS